MNRPTPATSVGNLLWSGAALIGALMLFSVLVSIGTPDPPPNAPAPALGIAAEAPAPVPASMPPLPHSGDTAPATDLPPTRSPSPDPEIYHDLDPGLDRDDDDHHHHDTANDKHDRGRRHGHRVWEWIL